MIVFNGTSTSGLGEMIVFNGTSTSGLGEFNMSFFGQDAGRWD